MEYKITSAYEHALQAVYFDISNRGICVNTKGIKSGIAIASAEIDRYLSIASQQWGCKVYIGKENAPANDPNCVNINSYQGKNSFLNKLKNDLGYEVPKIPKKNEEGDYESEYSTGELALQKMLASNQFNYPGGDPAIRAILKVREYSKLRSGYLNARLLKRGAEYYYLSIYNVAGTVTGRRNSKKHTFGFGNNGQNFPKHSEIAELFIKCLVPRKGNIFLMIDQIQAEDWPVSALSQNLVALQELGAGVDRHTKLASMIFNIPISSKSVSWWKDSIERYLGKKVRHAHNYDMTSPRMSDELAKEGHSVPEPTCKFLLGKVDILEPNVKGVFHRYVQNVVSQTRILTTPFGRERQVLGVRPGEYNNAIFKECYAFIPQSTVGDNTGFSVLQLEDSGNNNVFIVQEGHDSIVQDLPRSVDGLYASLLQIVAAFKRRIRFHNGIEVEIPIEAELGLSFYKEDRIKIKEVSRQAVKEALEKLEDLRKSTQMLVELPDAETEEANP